MGVGRCPFFVVANKGGEVGDVGLGMWAFF